MFKGVEKGTEFPDPASSLEHETSVKSIAKTNRELFFFIINLFLNDANIRKTILFL
jgi:hypothetical protein